MASKLKNKLPIQSKKPIPVEIVHTPSPVNKIDSDDRENKWKAEEALRDIEKAEKHKCDKELMKSVKVLAKQRVKTLSKI